MPKNLADKIGDFIDKVVFPIRNEGNLMSSLLEKLGRIEKTIFRLWLY
jgi:archaellum component FlaC